LFQGGKLVFLLVFFMERGDGAQEMHKLLGRILANAHQLCQKQYLLINRNRNLRDYLYARKSSI
jgi:hypothetical protein